MKNYNPLPLLTANNDHPSRQDTWRKLSRIYAGLLLLTLGLATKVSAQLASLTGIPVTVQNCGPASTFSVQLNPGAAASTGNSLTLTLPAGIAYVAGSATVDNGVTITGTGGTAQTPVFNFTSLPGASTTTLTFNVTAGCAYGGGQNFGMSFTGSAGNTSANSTSINSQSAVLIMPSMTNQNYLGGVGSNYSRNISMENTGNGYVDTLRLADTVGKGLYISGISGPGIVTQLQSKTAVNGGNDTAFTWKVYGFGPGVGNGNGLFETGESLTITQQLRIVGCTNINDRLYASLLCNGGIAGCAAPANINGGATVPSLALPVFTISSPYASSISNTAPAISCADGSTLYPYKMKFVNNSSSAQSAQNVRLMVGGTTYQGGMTLSNAFSSSGHTWIDPATLQVKINNGSFVSVLPDTSLTLSAATGRCAAGLPYMVGVTIPVLAPGDSAVVSFNRLYCTPADISCSSFGFDGLMGSALYKDQCMGLQSVPAVLYSINGTSFLAPSISASVARNTANLRPVELYPASACTLKYDISLAPGTAGNVTAALYEDTLGYVIYRVTLPAQLIFSGSPADAMMGAIAPVSVTPVAPHTYDIRFNASQFSGKVLRNGSGTLQFNLTTGGCVRAGSYQDTLSISVIQHVTGMGSCTSSADFSLTCFADVLSFKCPALCTRGGLNGTRVNIVRTSLGLPDNNQDYQPDGFGSLDMTKINLAVSEMGDTFRVLGTGVVNYGVVSNFTYGYMQPDFNTNNTGSNVLPAGALTAYQASVSIYAAGTRTLLGTGTIPVNAATGNNSFKADFSIANLGAFIPGYTQFGDGDSVAVTMMYKINKVAGLITYRGQFIERVSDYLYLSNIANPISAADIYACDTAKDIHGIQPFAPYAFGASVTAGNSCDSITIVPNPLGLLGNSYPSGAYTTVFPYEFRTFAVPDRVVIMRPAGLNFSNNVSGRFIRNIPGGSGSQTVDLSSYTTFYKDSIVVSNIRSLYADKGGPVILPDESSGLFVTLRAAPNCGSGSTTYNFTGKYSFVGVNDTTYNSLTPMIDNFSATQQMPVLSATVAPQTQTVSGNTAVWEVQMSNSSAIAAPANLWLGRQSNQGTTNIISVQTLSGPGGTVTGTVPVSNGVFQLGALATNTNRYFRITAGFANCSKDTLQLAYGWSCTGYPASVAAASCSNNALPLYVIPQPGQLQLSLLTQPVMPQQLCVDTAYVLQLNNVQLGTVYAPAITASLPAGFAITPGSSIIEYPAGVFSAIPDPVLSGGKYTWDIGALPALGGVLPGVTSVKLTFRGGASGCAYASGDYPQFSGSGKSGCGSALSSGISVAAPYVLQGDPLNTVNSFILRKNVSSMQLPVCADPTFTYTYTAVNNGVSPSKSATETLVIEAPSGLSLVPASFTGIKNAPLVTTPILSTSGGLTTYKWNMPDGIVVGDSVQFSIKFSAGSSAPACGSSFAIRNMVTNTFSTSAVACAGGGTCNAISIRGLDTVTVTVVKPDLAITNVTHVSGSFSKGGAATLAVSIKNNGTIPVAASAYVVEFFCGNGTTLLASASFPAAIAAGASQTANMTFSIPAGSCASGSFLTAKIRTTTAASVDQCICSASSFTMQDYALPLTLLEFKGQRYGSTDQLAWTTAEEENVHHFELEYSPDGQKYNVIALISPTGNNSSLKQAYSYRHTDVSGLALYRLKIVNTDGSYAYGNVVRLDGESTGALEVSNLYPIPFASELNLMINSPKAQQVQLMVIDGIGQVLSRQVADLQVGSGVYTLTGLGNLAAGNYFVRVLAEDGTVMNYQATKQ